MNDSKFIGMAVYNVAALSAIGVTCTYALSSSQSSQEAGYMVVCLCIILCNTVTICLVFVPKVGLSFNVCAVLFRMLSAGGMQSIL